MVTRVLFASFLAVFLAFGALAGESAPEPDGITEPIPVTVEELDKKTENLHGKRIMVEGFLVRDNYYFTLYSDLNHYIAFHVQDYEWDMAHPVEVEFWPEIYYKNKETFISQSRPFYGPVYYNRTVVQIIGTFDLTQAGYIPKTGEWVVVAGGGPKITNVESLRIIERPYIYSRTIKRLQTFHDEANDEKPYFEILNPNDPEFSALNRLTTQFVQAIKDRDFIFLRQSIYQTENEPPNAQNIGNPGYFYTRLLFEKGSPLQRALVQQEVEGPVIMRPMSWRENPDEEFYREACFCIDGECDGLWPVTLTQRVYWGILDDFTCISLIKTEDGWKWYY